MHLYARAVESERLDLDAHDAIVLVLREFHWSECDRVARLNVAWSGNIGTVELVASGSNQPIFPPSVRPRQQLRHPGQIVGRQRQRELPVNLRQSPISAQGGRRVRGAAGRAQLRRAPRGARAVVVAPAGGPGGGAGLYRKRVARDRAPGVKKNDLKPWRRGGARLPPGGPRPPGTGFASGRREGKNTKERKGWRKSGGGFWVSDAGGFGLSKAGARGSGIRSAMKECKIRVKTR